MRVRSLPFLLSLHLKPSLSFGLVPLLYHSPLPPQPISSNLYELVVTATRIKKDEEFRCPGEGAFGDKVDCDKYYVCQEEGGKGDEFSCLFPLTGLLFSPADSSCQYAAKVLCAGDAQEDSEFQAVEADYDVESTVKRKELSQTMITA